MIQVPLAFLAAWLCMGPAALAQTSFTVPANDGFVTQTTSLLSPEQEQKVEAQLSAYRTETSNEIAVLIVEKLDGIPAIDAALQTLRSWKVGRADVNNGAVILVSRVDRQMAIAVGYGLEGAVPDLVAKGIIERDITPYFKNEDYSGGLTAGITALGKHIGGEYTAERYTQSSMNWEEALMSFFFFVMYIFGSYFASTKSWWQGGIIGGVFGLVLYFIQGSLLAIPVFAVLGLGTDFILSQMGWQFNSGSRYRRGFGGFGGRRGGGGGFSGFSGGSGGGGGASGSW